MVMADVQPRAAASLAPSHSHHYMSAWVGVLCLLERREQSE
jgi:hypothetical protein